MSIMIVIDVTKWHLVINIASEIKQLYIYFNDDLFLYMVQSFIICVYLWTMLV